MIVAAAVPVDIKVVVNPEEPSPILETEFEARGCKVSIQFPQAAARAESAALHFRYLAISLENLPDSVAAAVRQGGPFESLVELLLKITNRVLSSIRNFGIVENVRPFRMRLPPERILRCLSVQTTEDGVVWKPLVRPPDEFDDLRAEQEFLSSPPNGGELFAERWSNVVEALDEKLWEPPPENEFLVNALEHLRSGALRLAVVEAIIGLEIVLSEFLSENLKHHRGLPSGTAEGLLNDLGLTARFGALLHLMLSSDAVKQVQFERVCKVIGWRNGIAHRTGRLPQNITEAEVRDGVFATLQATAILARERTRARLQPEADRIANTLKEHFGIPLTLELGSEHNARATITWFGQFADVSERCALLGAHLLTMLEQRNPRFDARRHFTLKVRSADVNGVMGPEHIKRLAQELKEHNEEDDI